VSLWHFHVCIYYNWNWSIPFISLLSILVPLWWWFKKIVYSFLYRKYITHSHHLIFLLLPSFSCY
jgi:hypothetical protein